MENRSFHDNKNSEFYSCLIKEWELFKFHEGFVYICMRVCMCSRIIKAAGGREHIRESKARATGLHQRERICETYFFKSSRRYQCHILHQCRNVFLFIQGSDFLQKKRGRERETHLVKYISYNSGLFQINDYPLFSTSTFFYKSYKIVK